MRGESERVRSDARRSVGSASFCDSVVYMHWGCRAAYGSPGRSVSGRPRLVPGKGILQALFCRSEVNIAVCAPCRSIGAPVCGGATSANVAGTRGEYRRRSGQHGVSRPLDRVAASREDRRPPTPMTTRKPSRLRPRTSARASSTRPSPPIGRSRRRPGSHTTRPAASSTATRSTG